MNREAIVAALETQLLTATLNFPTHGRKFVRWTKIAEFPAMFVQLMGARYDRLEIAGLQVRRTLYAEVWLYTKASPGTGSIESPMNAAIDAIEATLAGGPLEEPVTLGGLVFHTWIEGEVEQYPGVEDSIEKAIIPVWMLVP